MLTFKGGLCMKIQNLKVYAAYTAIAASAMVGSIAYSNAQIEKMQISFQESIDEYTEKEELMLQKYDDLLVEFDSCQQEMGKMKRQFNLLLNKQEEKAKEKDTKEEVNEDENRINSIVISKQEDGQYLLNFYKVGVQPYDYMMTTDIASTLTSVDSSYIENIETVFLDGCDDPKVFDVIQHFKKLKKLNLDDCAFTDVSKIARLNEIEFLRISGCPNVSDISSFKTLANLKVFILNDTEVEDIEALSYLPSLEVADLKGNKIVNPCCLQDLPKLYSLVLTDNCITNPYYLSGLVDHSIISDKDVQEIINSDTPVKAIKGTL